MSGFGDVNVSRPVIQYRTPVREGIRFIIRRHVRRGEGQRLLGRAKRIFNFASPPAPDFEIFNEKILLIIFFYFGVLHAFFTLLDNLILENSSAFSYPTHKITYFPTIDAI